MKANMDIRLAAAGAGIYLWQIAEAMGITEFTLSRRLRHELPEDEREKIMGIIAELSKSGVKS